MLGFIGGKGMYGLVFKLMVGHLTDGCESVPGSYPFSLKIPGKAESPRGKDCLELVGSCQLPYVMLVDQHQHQVKSKKEGTL